ncbi:MAG: hypothetical protein A2068_08265 [Ignavibacteria bacterium GWB2_35_6b]|nr:MAG: hypothetical protein A2068_08265 [Ignavibacteria bacterium GWB2_35_6b]
MYKKIFVKFFILFSFIYLNTNYAQIFTRVTDNNNPIVSNPAPAGYVGISWVDYNNDNNLDLFINNNVLFQNSGGGIFTKITTAIGTGQILGTFNAGNSWADYDNDGDLDVYLSGVTSFLYRNDGGDSFTKITTGEIGNGANTPGWACTWGDYNNDSFVDLVITNPAGFVTNNPGPNHLFQNNGDGTLTKIISGDVVTGLAPYTVPTWSDYDGDGDLDLSIGSGPANGTTAADFFYKNNFTETGTATLTRITTGGPATDKRDGQVWNWIDYDNDGDLDVYITNWGGTIGGIVNDFYRNDNGNFTKITTGNIVTDNGISLPSVWADFDNDGYIDCYVGNEGGWPGRLYKNNTDGTFTTITGSAVNSTTAKRSASAGDYDNDGRVDLITMGNTLINLYHNETANNYNWVSFKLEGTTSNKAAIGAKIRIKATVLGKTFWQMREISAQNSFNSQSDLRAHFGLSEASTIDSVKVEWLSGHVDVAVNININQFYNFKEGEGISTPTGIEDDKNVIPSEFKLEQNYPNPFNPSTNISFTIPNVVDAYNASTTIVIKIFDVIGNEIATLVNEQKSPGIYKINFDAENLSSGVYYYQLIAGSFIQTKKMILLR